VRRVATITAAALLAGTALTAAAQDAGETEDETAEGGQPSEPTINGQGAQVLRETTEEETVVLDENGEPVLDESGNEVTETTTSNTQTVTTPSGNVITRTQTVNPDGTASTDVSLERAETPGAAERPDRPEKPERAERAERPERPEKPEKPEKPERPEAPGRS